jgi:hypothetical protein
MIDEMQYDEITDDEIDEIAAIIERERQHSRIEEFEALHNDDFDDQPF